MTRENGSALIAVFVLIAIFGAAVALIVPNALRGLGVADLGNTETRIQRLARGSDEAYRHMGQFPSDLDNAERLGFVTKRDRIDPFGGGADLGYGPPGATTVTITSRGPDRLADTNDDISEAHDARNPGRARSRNRLRLWRARFYLSDYLSAPSMTAQDRKEIRERMRWIAIKMRWTYHSPRPVQNRLRRDVRKLRAELHALLAHHKVQKVPKKATGPKGLAQSLGLPDALAVDGLANTFSTDREVGFSSDGLDLKHGTRDDF